MRHLLSVLSSLTDKLKRYFKSVAYNADIENWRCPKNMRRQIQTVSIKRYHYLVAAD